MVVHTFEIAGLPVVLLHDVHSEMQLLIYNPTTNRWLTIPRITSIATPKLYEIETSEWPAAASEEIKCILARHLVQLGLVKYAVGCPINVQDVMDFLAVSDIVGQLVHVRSSCVTISDNRIDLTYALPRPNRFEGEEAMKSFATPEEMRNFTSKTSELLAAYVQSMLERLDKQKEAFTAAAAKLTQIFVHQKQEEKG